MAQMAVDRRGSGRARDFFYKYDHLSENDRPLP